MDLRSSLQEQLNNIPVFAGYKNTSICDYIKDYNPRARFREEIANMVTI